MKATYDHSVDAAYIYLVPEIVKAQVKNTYCCDPREVNGQINLDFDESGRLLGIEILDATRLLHADILDKAKKLNK